MSDDYYEELEADRKALRDGIAKLRADNARLRGLVVRAINSRFGLFKKSEQNWVAMKELFAFGSTNAVEICKEHGINPHGEIQDREIALAQKEAAHE